MPYVAAEERYDRMPYNRCGRAASPARRSRSVCGRTSAASVRSRRSREIVRRAFDLGVTHFDLANNYGSNTSRTK